MKKIFLTLAAGCGVWAGAHGIRMNSANAQTGLVTTTIIPLTNQAPFTNTLVQPTNLSTIQLSNVVSLLLALETNVEETLPVLDLIQSNAMVVSVTPTNSPQGVVPPLTSNLAGMDLTPTGTASGKAAVAKNSLVVKIGAETFDIDPATLQALFVLRGNLQQTLLELQQLNGTTPASPKAAAPQLQPPVTFIPPTVTNFSPGPLTNTLAFPLTNAPPFSTSGMPSAF